MGIRGLQFYLEKCCPSASPNVDVRTLVNQHRRSTRSNNEPVIVVDGSSCIRILYGDLDWIGGGQLNEFAERAEHFVAAFRKIGVRLVFFFDGPTEGRKRRTWVERRMNSLEKVYHVLDAISRGKMSYDIDRSKYFLLPPGMGQLCRVVFEIICGCEVYQSLTECDEEIAYYAKTRGAFAILSQDSDFVVLDSGGALYLSMEKLNLLTMQTLFYNPEALANQLKIEFSQLPLLATLMGNDIIPFDDLKPFHTMLTNSRNNQRVDFRQLVPRLANYIRTLPSGGNLSQPDLQDISQRILGDPSRYEDIRTSIRSYNDIRRRDFDAEDRASSRSREWSYLLSVARDKHINNKIPGMIYAIMKGLPFESSTIMEDYRKHDLPAFAPVTLPIRKRLYGILLQEKVLEEGEELNVEEWCMAGPGSLDEPNLVKPEFLARRHPGLRALWGDNPKWTFLRWRLFVQSVSPNLNVNALRSIPPYMVIPTMILFFISQYLEPWEIDATLAAAACLKHYDNAMLHNLPSDPLRPRGIRLSALIMRTTFILYILLAACGFPLTIEQTAPWQFFDGKLFQAKYFAAEGRASHDRLCEHRVDVLEHFMMARQIILDRQHTARSKPN